MGCFLAASHDFAGFGIVDRNSPNEHTHLQDLFPCGFIRPERFVDACHILQLSGDPPACLDEVPPVRQLLRRTYLDPAWFGLFAPLRSQPAIEALITLA